MGSSILRLISKLEFFAPDRHIVHRFNSILDSTDLPMNGLHDSCDIPRSQTNVVTDRSNLEAHRIDHFLCFMGCPTDLKKNGDQEDEDQNQDCRDDGDADRH